MFVNFEKPDEEVTTFKIKNLEGQDLYFEHRLSKFRINLDEKIAIETRSGEKLIYKCALKSFKMWRKRVQGRKTKHSKLREFESGRFKCTRQKQISDNSISKR